MAAIIGSIKLRLLVDDTSPMRRSIASIINALGIISSEQIRDAIREVAATSPDDLAGRTFKGGNLLSIEPVDGPACRAMDIRFRCEPGNGYVELVSAIALDLDDKARVELDHGWPILSVVSAHSTVATGGEAASLPAASAPALCTTCDHRLDDTAIRACSVRDCPHAQREAA